LGFKRENWIAGAAAALIGINPPPACRKPDDSRSLASTDHPAMVTSS